MVKRAQDMEVFKLSHSLTLDIYKLTEGLPDKERFGLSAQMRRSAYSIPMNLAEGAARLSSKEYRQFVSMARGSASEISYQLLLCKDLGYITQEHYVSLDEKCTHVARMLTGLIKNLNS